MSGRSPVIMKMTDHSYPGQPCPGVIISPDKAVRGTVFSQEKLYDSHRNTLATPFNQKS